MPVYNYAVSRGKCDAFAERGRRRRRTAPTPAYINQIRNNFGLGCNGVRLPATASTLYTASGKLNYTYGTGSRLSLSLATSRNQGHTLPVHHPLHQQPLAPVVRLAGSRNRNYFATLELDPEPEPRAAERALALDVALSYQQDRTINGPLHDRERSLHP